MRALTVSSVHREWGQGHRRSHARVPALRLNGRWLEQLGFSTGTKVRVAAQEGALVITRSES